jgi:acyl-CoA dehydrogenase
MTNFADNAIFPLSFSTQRPTPATDLYLRDPATRKLADFFEAKGLPALKKEDRAEEFYEDWISFQASNRIYASLLSPKEFSTRGNQLDLLRLTRFLEVFAYFSPAHGYSFQVSFLGLFSILMGSNAALKKQAVATLEAGGLFAFGISEQHHGSDLLGNEFAVKNIAPGRFIASGGKYYIGNANCAAIVSILARKVDDRPGSHSKRAMPILFALRPKEAKGYGNVRKIPTVGVRSAFVGQFEVTDHEFPESDLIAEGRDAWDAVLGTVTLGKFFLGFGSIGICERALQETTEHLTRRILYGKPVIQMPHIASLMCQAYARLTAMKLYAYRALDYLHAASENDRRYLLLNAIQKAKVSTEGVKVMALLSECIGAKGFESETYFEMALRDIQLIPGLEGSTHVNLSLAAQFIPKYFNDPDRSLAEPKSLAAQNASDENSYLMQARGGNPQKVAFPFYLTAFLPHLTIASARAFAFQARAFRWFLNANSQLPNDDMQVTMAIADGFAMIVYGQLVAENCIHCAVPREIVSVIFQLLAQDLAVCGLKLASNYKLEGAAQESLGRMVRVAKTAKSDWDFILQKLAAN